MSKRGRSCGTCKNCQNHRKCDNRLPTTTGGPPAKISRTDAAPRYPSRVRKQFVQQPPDHPMIRDRRLSTSHARHSSHNERAGSSSCTEIEQQLKYEKQQQQQQQRRRIEKQRLQQQQQQQQERQATLRTRRSHSSSDEGDNGDNDDDGDEVSPLERLMDIAEYLDVDPNKLIQLRSLTTHAGSKASSASAMIGKRTGENLGSILTELLKLMLESITFNGEADTGGLFSLMVQCSKFQKQLGIINVNESTSASNSLRILNESIRDAWRQAKREGDNSRATELVSLLTKNNTNAAMQSLLNDVVVIEIGSSVLIGKIEGGNSSRSNIQFNKDRIGIVKKLNGTKACVKPKRGDLIKNVDLQLLQHVETLMLSDQKITSARQHRELHGPGASTPVTEVQEYKTIEQYQVVQFCQWVMEDETSSTCKMSARNLKAGHMRFLRHKIVKVFYEKYCTAVAGEPLSWKAFVFILSDPIFVVLGPDHCVCPQCFKLAFREMQLRGPELFALIASILGDHEVKSMIKRLHALISFQTTERARHIEITSHAGNHCATHLGGSSTDQRYDTPCTHNRIIQDTREPSGPQVRWEDGGNRVGTTNFIIKTYGAGGVHSAAECHGKKHASCFPQRNNICDCCDHAPKNTKKVGQSMVICEFCQIVACRGANNGKACADRVAGDKLGPIERKKAVFTCKTCQNDKNLDLHSTVCGLCDETTVYQNDLKRLIRRACGDTIDPEENQEEAWVDFMSNRNLQKENASTRNLNPGDHIGVWWPNAERIYGAEVVGYLTASSSSTSSSTSTPKKLTVKYDDCESDAEEETFDVLEDLIQPLKFVTVREKRTRDNWRGVVINTREEETKPYQVAAIDDKGVETAVGKAWWYSESRLIFEEEGEEEDEVMNEEEQEKEQEDTPPPPPTTEQKIVKKGNDLLRAVDHLDRHQIRVGMQSRYKPTMFDLILHYKLYNVIYGISDFWAKFEGVSKLKANCQNNAKTSVEGHVIVGLIPPGGFDDVDWDSFDDTCRMKTVGAFFVLYVTQISSNTTQDWKQMMCNRLALLHLLKKMFPHVNGILWQSDGAYNTNAMSLHMASLGDMTGIHVLANAFTEAGHGGERVDSTGAGSIGHMWRYHALFGIPLESPRIQATALDWKPNAGHVVRIIDHDSSIWNAVDQDSKFPIPSRDTLIRIYPVSGILPPGIFSESDLNKFSGGVVFYRFIGLGLSGLGPGVGFTKEKLCEMRGGNTLDKDIVVSSEKSGTRSAPETATYDLSRQDRKDEIARLEQFHSQRAERSQQKMESDVKLQRQQQGQDKLKEIIERKEETKNSKNLLDGDGDNIMAMEQTAKKLTKTEALLQVRRCVTENFTFRRGASRNYVSMVKGINFCIVDESLLANVQVENQTITAIPNASKLWDHGVLGWKIVPNGTNEAGKVMLQRPLLTRVPRRGYAQRPHEGNKKTTPSQKAFLKKNASNKPKLVNAARLSRLSKIVCGELNFLEPEQIQQYAAAWERNQKELKNKAYEREGMPSYSKYDVTELQDLCNERDIKYRGNAGFRRLRELLEDWDDENTSSGSDASSEEDSDEEEDDDSDGKGSSDSD